MFVGVYERETDVRAVFDGRFLAMLIQKKSVSDRTFGTWLRSTKRNGVIVLVCVYERETDLRAVFDGRFLAIADPKKPVSDRTFGTWCGRRKEMG